MTLPSCFTKKTGGLAAAQLRSQSREVIYTWQNQIIKYNVG